MKRFTKLFFLMVAIAAWGNVANATNTECAGTLTTAAQGTFTLGYNYTFTTSGTSVTITFELLDTQVGLVPQLVTPANVYTNMTLVSGQKYTYTLTGQTPGATITYACYFAYSGGASRTTDLTYIVGDACGGVVDTQAPTGFTATLGTVGATTADIVLNGTDDSGSVTYSIVYGTTTVSTSSASGVQKTYTVTGLAPSTAYSFAVTAKDATGNIASNSPITLTTTTTALLAPTVAAPTPPVYNAAKVISIFSDAYTNVAGTDFNPGWGQSGSDVIVQVAGNNTLKMSNLNYQGIAFGSHVYPLTMKYLHIDVWTPNETSLQIYPICQKNGTEELPEKFKQLSNPILNQWNSYDIPITDFTSQGLSMADVYQFKFVGSGGKTVYIDNLYFYDNTATVDSNPPTAFTATSGAITSDAVELLLNATDDSGAINYTISYGTGPTVVTTAGVSGTQLSFTVSGLKGSTLYNFSVTANDPTGNPAANNPIVVSATTSAAMAASPTPTIPAANVFSIYSDAYTTTATSLQYQVWWTAGWSDVTLADGGNAKKIVATNGGGGVGIQFDNLDVSSMGYFHIDVYPTTATSSVLKYNVVPVGGGGNGWTAFQTLTANQWNQCNVPISALGLPGTSVFQIGIGTFGGDGTFFIDNVYFSKSITTGMNSIETIPAISCYPNPITNKLTVSARTEISQLTVRNLLGQSVKTATVNGFEKVIDLSDVASGNYLLTVKLANGQLSTQKIVKL